MAAAAATRTTRSGRRDVTLPELLPANRLDAPIGLHATDDGPPAVTADDAAVYADPSVPAPAESLVMPLLVTAGHGTRDVASPHRPAPPWRRAPTL